MLVFPTENQHVPKCYLPPIPADILRPDKETAFISRNKEAVPSSGISGPPAISGPTLGASVRARHHARGPTPLGGPILQTDQ